MDEKILEQLKLLNRYVQYLTEIAQSNRSAFIDDFIVRAAAERYLQLAIECCINTGNRILSVIQMKEPVSTPETYADIVYQLGKLGILPEDFVETMIRMVRFRNRIVHMYWDIDPEQLYDILQNHMTDFTRFREYVVDYLNRTSL